MALVSARKPTGYVLWEGRSRFDGAPIVLILTIGSSNRKTGAMWQTWILRSDVSPVDAIASGEDVSVCGGCTLRGFLDKGKRVERACYVNVSQAPLSVWRKYRRGGYPKLSRAEAARMLAGQAVRLGAYGDPAMVPFGILGPMVRRARLWTGYTHQWRTTNQAWAGLLMASCETVEDMALARAAGWRAFLVTGASSKPAGTVQCAADRDSNPLQCADCGMCSGTRRGAVAGAVSVWIQAHGSGAKYVPDSKLV